MSREQSTSRKRSPLTLPPPLRYTDASGAVVVTQPAGHVEGVEHDSPVKTSAHCVGSRVR
eukprot:scaffold5568_cov45-Isochrysis_galbana.AAC.1